jgi:hypothetical protein
MVKILIIACIVCFPAMLRAVPNTILGPIGALNSPLNGRDLTTELTAAGLWKGDGRLPGEWQDEARVASAEISHLLARPKFLGQEVVLLRATKREGRLVGIDATFVDAGSYFGYFDEKLPEGLTRRAAREEIAQRTAKRQAEFAEMYQNTLGALEENLAALPDAARPKSTRVGHTRTLRGEVKDFRSGDLVFRLLAADQRLIRVSVAPAGELAESWLDPSLEALAPRERLPRLKETVRKDADGTVSIGGLEPVPQGYRPYCGLNSLAMAARHFGLHVDEDWLAAAGGFKNTGSADGSDILGLYPAVAAEAGFSMARSSRFDAHAVCRALDAGFPVIVWRRFSMDRDRLHTRFARDYARDAEVALPDPALPAERATWPGADAPLHASVLTGYHPERREILFLESWTGKDTPRRMRMEEMAATAYLTFVFQP